MTTQPDVRRYNASAASTATFGRVLCSTRDQHYVADGPAANGCPGEAPTPAELFLSGITACGVELIQVLARQDGIPLTSIRAEIDAFQDRTAPVHQHVSSFNRVQLAFELSGVSESQAADLVERFKRR
ncbi:MAG: OsmC family protein [Chloroflexi bacterium]|nr:OsmC family protein [Chloroflexota bacterium]